jgi:hypothetical protein
MILQWQHTSGFSVHNQVRIACDDTKGQEALAQISEQRETSIYYPESFFPEKSFLSAGDRPGFIYRKRQINPIFFYHAILCHDWSTTNHYAGGSP